MEIVNIDLKKYNLSRIWLKMDLNDGNQLQHNWNKALIRMMDDISLGK